MTEVKKKTKKPEQTHARKTQSLIRADNSECNSTALAALELLNLLTRSGNCNMAFGKQTEENIQNREAKKHQKDLKIN